MRKRAGDIGSGPAHVRYGHSCGPTRIDLRCPACGAKAVATLPSHASGDVLLGDLSPEYRSAAWRFVCGRCPRRVDALAYDAMRAQAPLWFDLRDEGKDLWAWNAEHLAMLLDVFEGRSVARNPYGVLATYVPGGWKGDADRYAKWTRGLLARG